MIDLTDTNYIRPIKGYEGKYYITRDGQVWSTYSNKFLTLIVGPKGYLRVNLYNHNIAKVYRINRLVAEAFIPNPNNLPQVNHKDENKQNNNVENLEWCTPKYNNNYGTHNARVKENLIKKHAHAVIMYDDSFEIIKEFCSVSEAARFLGKAKSNIFTACKKGTKAYGYY